MVDAALGFIVTLNLVVQARLRLQGPSCLIVRTARERWVLNQVQHDEVKG
jgi:hypothetical protein